MEDVSKRRQNCVRVKTESRGSEKLKNGKVVVSRGGEGRLGGRYRD